MGRNTYIYIYIHRERESERERCISVKLFISYKHHHEAEEEEGRGLEMSTDLTGWERWRRVLPTSDSVVNSERSGCLGFLFLLNPKSPL